MMNRLLGLAFSDPAVVLGLHDRAPPPTFLEGFLRLLPRKTIFDSSSDSKYITRYYLLRSSWFGPWAARLPSLYLHHIHRPDVDPELHNHPWSYAFALLLRGGYVEERRVVAEGTAEVVDLVRLPGAVVALEANTFHRISRLHDPENGSWSLFVAGPRVQAWGFWNRETGCYSAFTEAAGP